MSAAKNLQDRTAAQIIKKLPKRLPRPHQAPNTAASSPNSTSQLTFSNFKILDFSKKDLRQNRKALSKKQNFPMPTCKCNYPYSTERRRRRGYVGFASAKQGKADGGCSRKRRAVQRSSQLGGSAQEGRPAASSRGRTLTPNARDVQ